MSFLPLSECRHFPANLRVSDCCDIRIALLRAAYPLPAFPVSLIRTAVNFLKSRVSEDTEKVDPQSLNTRVSEDSESSKMSSLRSPLLNLLGREEF
jgi:hypothetical protein